MNIQEQRLRLKNISENSPSARELLSNLLSFVLMDNEEADLDEILRRRGVGTAFLNRYDKIVTKETFDAHFLKRFESLRQTLLASKKERIHLLKVEENEQKELLAERNKRAIALQSIIKDASKLIGQLSEVVRRIPVSDLKNLLRTLTTEDIEEIEVLVSLKKISQDPDVYARNNDMYKLIRQKPSQVIKSAELLQRPEFLKFA